jgi:hypothetical protein
MLISALLEVGVKEEEIVEMALVNKCPSISYTYTEPTVFLEYAFDIMKLAADVYAEYQKTMGMGDAASKLKNSISVSYDSSSYNIGSIYRTYYLPFDFGPHLSFGEKYKTHNPHIKKLPCDCPVCRTITSIEELNTGDIYAGTLISLHNLYQYKYFNDILNSLVVDKELFIDYITKINISEKTLKSIEFIDFCMEKGLENGIEKFKEWFNTDEFSKLKQSNIFTF